MIPYGRHHIDESDIEAVADLMRNGSLTQGPIVEEFERAISSYVGAKYAVAVSSATAGLHISAVAAGVSPGKTLITSPITFVASSNAALYSGGSPAFADIDPETINLCPQSLDAALKRHPNTKAVVPVHFAGLACDMEPIAKSARMADALVIEDAAHALGGQYSCGSMIGSNKYADMTVFSFHPVKAIAAGEGGIVTTNDEELYRRLLRLRSHGINKLDDDFLEPQAAQTDGLKNPWYYEMRELGYHYRITDIQCALALSQLKKLDSFVQRRRALAKAYDEAFTHFKNVKPAQKIGRDRSGHHIYVIKIRFSSSKLTRAQLMMALRERGIGSQVHYIPVPHHPYYRKLNITGAFPFSEKYYEEALTIPLFVDLTDEEQQLVITALKDLVE